MKGENWYLNKYLQGSLTDSVCSALLNLIENVECVEGIKHCIQNLPEHTIKDIINDTENAPISVEKIISEVARSYNVSENDILSNRRTANLVLARKSAMFITREITDLSYKQIGEAFGKDHTTVLYSVQSIETFLQDKPYEKELIEDIIKNLKSVN